MKLISMTDFVSKKAKQGVQGGRLYNKRQTDILFEIYKYNTFLKRLLELGMFIPTDKEGNVMMEPRNYGGKNLSKEVIERREIDMKQFEEAKERCLFEGDFKITESGEGMFLLNEEGVALMFRDTVTYEWKTIMFRTIEDLVLLDLTLTETAKRLINK